MSVRLRLCASGRAGLVAAALAALTPSGAAAQVTLTAAAGVAGGDVAGMMLPVRVEISNGGGPVRGLIEVRRSGAFTIQAEKHILRLDPLPGAARQQFWFYLPPRRDSAGAPVEVRLAIEGRPDQTQVLTPGSIGAAVPLVYEIGEASTVRKIALPAGAAAASSQQKQQPQVRHLPPELVPDNAAGLTPADLIILNGVDPSTLTQEQRRAITEAVARGLTLLVHPGSNLTLLRDPFYSNLLPADTEGAAPAPAVHPTGAAGGPPQLRFPAGVALARLLPRPGTAVRAVAAGRALLVRGTFGSGLVYLAAWSARDGHLPGAGAEGAWSSVLSEAVANRARFRSLLRAADVALTGSVSFSHPPPLPTLLFLVAYGLLLGPVHQRWLKRLGPGTRVWITMPILVLLACAAAAGATRIGAISPGGLTTATVIRLYSGGSQAVGGAWTLLSGSGQAIRSVTSSSDSGIPFLERPEDVRAGFHYDWTLQPALMNLRMAGGPGSLLYAPASLDLGGPVSFTVEDDGQVRLVNRTRFELRDMTLKGAADQSLGDAAAGETIRRMPSSVAAARAGGRAADGATAQLRRRLLAAAVRAEAAVAGRYGPMLTAWIEVTEPAIKLDPPVGRVAEATLLVIAASPAPEGSP